MGELRYRLNMVTRQEQFTSTNAFHSSNLLIFLSFFRVFIQWWRDELFKSADNTRVLLFTLRPTWQKSFFLKNPSKHFGGDNDCLSRKLCMRYDVKSGIRSNQISRSTRLVFGTVYLKMSQKIVTKQKKSFVSIAV